MQAVVLFLLISSICGWIVILYLLHKVNIKKYQADISRLLLLDEESNIKKEISLVDRAGILIGRSREAFDIGIALSEGDKEDVVAMEHAVLNYVDGEWYLEALHNEYATGLKKGNKELVYRLKVNMPYKIDAGDIIFISHHKLAVR